MLCQWFFTRRDGKRLGPYSPLVLNQIASSDQLQACPGVRKQEMGRAGKVKGRFPVALVRQDNNRD